MEKVNYIFKSIYLSQKHKKYNMHVTGDWKPKSTNRSRSMFHCLTLHKNTQAECVCEYGWSDDPATPSPSCHLHLVIPPCALKWCSLRARFPAIMNSSLSGCRAAEQRDSFVPRPSRTGRPIDDMLGLIRLWLFAACFTSNLSLKCLTQVWKVGWVYFFFNPHWDTSASVKLADEEKTCLVNTISCRTGLHLKCGRRATVGVTLLSALFLLLISCVIWCCEDRRAGPHTHSFAVYLRAKGHWLTNTVDLLTRKPQERTTRANCDSLTSRWITFAVVTHEKSFL